MSNPVTSLEDLKNASLYRILELPPFPNGVPLTVKIKSPSVINMMIEGKIVNPLQLSVKKVLGEDKEDKGAGKDTKPKKVSAKDQKSAFELMKTLARECLVEPTMDEIEQTVGGLTDSQIVAIYQAISDEVNNLSSFRNKPTDIQHSGNESEV